MKSTAEKIAVMQAYENGEHIEIKGSCYDNWADWLPPCPPSWDWGSCDYRVKPKEPHYRPYKDTDEMIADFDKRFHTTNTPKYAIRLIWITNGIDTSLITGFSDDSVRVNGCWFEFGELIESRTYLDGTPVGKLVEE